MIIIYFKGGLGNQLFQYSVYKRIKEIRKDCFADIEWYNVDNNVSHPLINDKSKNNSFQLELLGLKVQSISRKDYCVKEYYIKNHKITEDEFEKIRNTIRVPILNLVKESNCYACDKIWEIKDGYIAGFFQNLDNCYPVISDIKNEMRFPYSDNSEFNYVRQKIINDKNSVGIHVRFNGLAEDDFEKVCPVLYYEKAIYAIKKINLNSNFYFFSNDLNRAKTIFHNIDNSFFVDIHYREDGLGDFELLSLCKNFIISNSTYSWWAAVLSKDSQSIVIAPDNFSLKLPNIQKEDINLWPEGWIRL